MKNAALFVVLFLSTSAVQAQTAGVVTLRANATSATGSMAPVLTWSTSPVATSCNASGGWSGTRAASGTQTLAAITASTSYTLTCTWNSGSARVSWTAPTTNTNDTPLTNLAAYRIYYGTSANSLSQTQEVNDISSSVATINPLVAGTWYFKVRAVNANQIESADSNIASKVVAGSSAASTVNITITASPTPTPTPPPTPTPTPTPTRVTIATTVYDVVRGSTGRWVLGRRVGTIPIGKPCRTYRLTGDYYGVLTGRVKITRPPRGDTLVAHCAFP